MFCDDSIRIPVSRELKKDFQQACRATNGKSMCTVSRDLFTSFTKSVRKALVFPGNYETPDYSQVIEASVQKEGAGFWRRKRP